MMSLLNKKFTKIEDEDDKPRTTYKPKQKLRECVSFGQLLFHNNGMDSQYNPEKLT